jgi:SAM-dependent methyltransferase
VTRRLNDPDLVRAEYADESRLAARSAVWELTTGPDAHVIALDALRAIGPRRVLEVGCGRGELAERIQVEVGAEVIAVDQSERMVELTRARGVDARVGDVQGLPFAAGSFDCAVAAWMLYHVDDLDRGLAELARVTRPAGRLVAITNTELNMPELWGRFGDRAVRVHGFNAENGGQILRRHFASVDRHDARGTVTFPDWEAARRYVGASITRRELAEELEPFEGPLVCSRHSVVFVAETAS